MSSRAGAGVTCLKQEQVSKKVTPITSALQPLTFLLYAMGLTAAIFAVSRPMAAPHISLSLAPIQC